MAARCGNTDAAERKHLHKLRLLNPEARANLTHLLLNSCELSSHSIRVNYHGVLETDISIAVIRNTALLVVTEPRAAVHGETGAVGGVIGNAAFSTQLRIISKGSGGASFLHPGTVPGLLLAVIGSRSAHTRGFTDPRPRELRIRFAYSIAGGIDKPEFTISDLLAPGGEYQLYQLTNFYKDRLQQAIEEKVERLGWMLTKKRHFSRDQNEKVTELTEKGKRAESSRLVLSLVMGKGSRALRAMWESFLMWRTELPKLDRILREIQELGPDPQEYMNIAQGLSELPPQLRDVQQKHKETLREQTETLRVNTILMTEKVKFFQLVGQYAELTVISTVRDRRLMEHELLARGRHHEEWRLKHLRGELEKIRTDQLLQSSFSRSKSKSGSSAAVAGVPGIGKTTMVQKIVYDWATGKIYQQYHFVFSLKFRDLNSFIRKINLSKLVLFFYPYLRNDLKTLWKDPDGLLFIFDGLDEFKDTIDFTDRRRNKERRSTCTDPEFKCKVSDIVYSLIQGKLLPGCSVLLTTRPSALHLLQKAKISIWVEIMGFVGEERKQYFIRHFKNQKVAEAVFKHVKENEILYTMSYNPSYCWILALTLGPYFTKRVRDPQLGWNELGNSGVKLVSAALRNPECKIQKLGLYNVGLTDSGTEDLISALGTNPSLTELNLGHNKLGDSGVKLVSEALTNPECKIQKLKLSRIGLTDSGAEDLVSALSTIPSLMELDLVKKLADRAICPRSPPPHTDPPESESDRAGVESVQ
ncbi:uncharacterized protein [Hemitrygon akajei]|uniref:uncharacterized protein n=1 Tax=Hemitrygon akajei TaxID=2704970 RepID=UPI003BF9F3B4